MNKNDVIELAGTQVGYHEKVANTPTADLYPFRNSYDGEANWTKYHHDISVAQGQAWCGFFLYWLFRQQFNSDAETAAALHGLADKGGATSAWAMAFGSVGQWHLRGDGYSPQPGDLAIYEDDTYPWSHVELVVDVSGYPSTIICIGGNTNNADDGSQAESKWVARRTRSCTATTGWRLKGFCEVDYDGSSGSIPDYLLAWWARKRKRKGIWY